MDRYYNDITEIYSQAIKSVNPYTAVIKTLSLQNSKLTVAAGTQKAEYDLDQYKNIFVMGAGKAAAPMAKAVEETLGARITKGLICVKYGHTEPLRTIETVEASHPAPDTSGMECADRILNLLQKADKNDLVISLISGGGSALLPLPVESVSLEDKISATNLLLECGASIHEINTVRKHISRSKGGNFARAAYPARVINLLISDVVGDDLDVIASGPFVPDTSTFHDTERILSSYKLTGKMPESIIQHIRNGIDGSVFETPKADDEIFTNVKNHIILSNYTALQEAADAADRLGYNTIILSSFLEGDTKESVGFHTAIVREIIKNGNPVKKPACLLSGGENTVVIKGSGKGGRNTEFAIQSAISIAGISGTYCTSIATDGTDGPTDAAGAIVDSNTVKLAESKGLDIKLYANNNDSYNFFQKLGTLIRTGPTKTNVMDLHIIIVT